MHFTKLSRNILFILLVIYYLQGILYPSGSMLSQTCLLLIFLISGLYFIKALVPGNNNGLFYNAWTVLLWLNIIGFIFTADFSNTTHISLFKSILGCMLPFYPFYYFAKSNELKSNHLIGFLLVMLPLTILQFNRMERAIILARVNNNADIVNNIAYSLVRLMPFVFLIKKKKLISATLMGIIVTFIIMGAKRGAIIAASIGLIMYLYYQFKITERQHRIRNYVVIIIIGFALIAFAFKNFINNENLMDRMISISEGSYSRRDLLYRLIIEKWYNCESIWNFLFGFGFGGSLELTGGHFAHNDWLELLSNFSFIGFFTYLFLFYAAIRTSMNSEWTTDKQILMVTIIMIWFFVSLISMWYMNFEGFTQAIILGYLIGSDSNSLE